MQVRVAHKFANPEEATALLGRRPRPRREGAGTQTLTIAKNASQLEQPTKERKRIEHGVANIEQQTPNRQRHTFVRQ